MDDRGETILYWLIFIFGAIVAGYHTFMVNYLVNPWWIALPSAAAVDGLLAYTIHNVRRWTGDKRLASFGGIILFALVSAVSQIIYHQTASGIALDKWLLFFATFVIPIASSTGSFVTIAVIQLFKQDGEVSKKVAPVPAIQPSKPSIQPPAPLAIEDANIRPSSMALAPAAFSAENGEAEVVKKRGPGRPPKMANGFAMENRSDPKLRAS
jgi:TM2 domain-containing membrane protein YozV